MKPVPGFLHSFNGSHTPCGQVASRSPFQPTRAASCCDATGTTIEITAGQYLQSIRASTLCTTTGFRAFRARFDGVTVEARCVSAVITPEGQLNLFAWFGLAVGDERRSSDWVQPEVDQTGSAAGRTVGEPSRRVATYRSLREVAGKRLGKQ